MTDSKGLIPIPLSELLTDTSMKLELHLRMGGEKFLKVNNGGHVFSAERVKSYVSKGVRSLYVAREDLATHVGFNLGSNPVADPVRERMVENARRAVASLTQKLVAGGLDREDVEDSAEVVLNAVHLLASAPESLKLLEKIETSADPMDHALAVALWSCLLGRQIGWAGQATYFRLTLSAIFHDIGEIESEAMSANQGHTVRGRDVLLQVPVLPEDASIVAAQHHEAANGTGYPYGLSLHQIHPFARLIAITDRLCELLKARGPASRSSIAECYKNLLEHQRNFDPTFLNALGILVSRAADLRGPL